MTTLESQPESDGGVDEAIRSALTALDLEQKIRLLTGGAMFALQAEPAIELPALVFSDGPTGVRGDAFTGGEPVAMFPNATLASSTWDEAALTGLGDALAEEAIRQGIDVVLGPTVNLHRTPLGGRLFEAYSEDPLLSGRLAAAYIRGMQRRGVGSSLKHWVANEAEIDRNDVDNIVAPAALRELYLLPFEISVQDALPWTVMAAYNDVNGVAATEHDELTNSVLKGEWGYDGVVMSDWFATKTTDASANGGLDLVMPGPAGPWGDALIESVRTGRVPEATIDDHLTRLLRLASRVGRWHAVPGTAGADKPEPGTIAGPASPERRALLRSAAAAGMTVLTGDPVIGAASSFTTDEPLVLVGRHAVATTLQGGGSAQVWPPHRVSILDGLRSALPDGTVRFADGVEVRTRVAPADPTAVRDPETGAPGLRVTSYRADGSVQASEVVEDPRVVLGFGPTPHAGAAVLELTAEIRVDVAAGVDVGVVGTGHWVLQHEGEEYVIDVELQGSDPGEGVLNPPMWSTTVTSAAGATVTARLDIPENVFGLYALVVQAAPRPVADVLAEAAETARDRRAVVVVGLTVEQETEAADKSTLALPGGQDALVAAVAATASSTTVIVNAATPVLMPWLSDVDAVIVIGLPGQEGGDAVADVLLGDREPTGRLVTTWPKRDGAGPAWTTTPTEGRLVYGEGVAMGYRGWWGSDEQPEFWLGHGLGWSSWDYVDAHAEASNDGGSRVVVRIRNAGERISREVVQVYQESDGAPVRLVGWAVADGIGPGEERVVVVILDERARRRWDEKTNEWVRLQGGELLVARGLGDVRLRLRL